MTIAQLQDYINTYIKANGRKAITGSQLNYLMLEFIDWVQTTTTSDVEDAIVNGVTDKSPSQNAVFDALAGKQATLVSGTNIKTLNGVSLLGSGDVSVQESLVSGTNIKTLNGVSLLGSGDIVLVSTPAGSNGQIQFNNSGSFGGDSELFWDNTNKRLGIGAAPATTVRLDLRLQGASSGDLGLRIRNSLNTLNIMSVDGQGNFVFSSMNTTNPSFRFQINEAGNQRDILQITSGGTNSSPSRVDISIPFSGGGIGMNIYNQLTGVDQMWLQINRNNFCLGSNTILTSTTDRRVVYINNGTAPNASVTDGFKMYSADIVAGNAAPHFRTEVGDIVKIYAIAGWGTPTGTLTRTAFDPSTVTLSELGERVAALITDLKTGHQLLKA